MIRILFNLLILIIFISCETSSNVENRLSKTNISVPSKYKIINFENDWAIGEGTEYYELLVSDEDYRKIILQIKKRPSFVEVNSIPVLNEIKNYDQIDEKACSYNDTYYYKIFSPKGYSISLSISDNFIMKLYYEDF
jgi:hypothetical protein